MPTRVHSAVSERGKGAVVEPVAGGVEGPASAVAERGREGDLPRWWSAARRGAGYGFEQAG